MDDKGKLETLINTYIKKIELIREELGEELADQYREEAFEDYALASGSITYAKLSGVISEEEATALKAKLSKASKEIKVADYIF